MRPSLADISLASHAALRQRLPHWLHSAFETDLGGERVLARMMSTLQEGQQEIQKEAA